METEHLDPHRVVVIESDDAIRSELYQLLSSGSFSAELTETFDDGSLLLAEYPPPGAVVLDVESLKLMPIEHVRRMRSQHPYMTIVVCARELTENQRKSLCDVGASACIAKNDLEVALVPTLRNLEENAERASVSQSGAYKREYPRYAVSIPAYVRRPAEGFCAVLKTVDVSAGGAFLRMPCPLSIGARLSVRLDFPQGSVTAASAQVVHRRLPILARKSGKAPGIGVVFYGMEPETRLQIANFAKHGVEC